MLTLDRARTHVDDVLNPFIDACVEGLEELKKRVDQVDTPDGWEDLMVRTSLVQGLVPNIMANVTIFLRPALSDENYALLVEETRQKIADMTENLKAAKESLLAQKQAEKQQQDL